MGSESILGPRVPLGSSGAPEAQSLVYSGVVGWRTLQMSIRSRWLIVLFKSSIPLLIFCLIVSSLIETENGNLCRGLETLSVRSAGVIVRPLSALVSWSVP